MARISDEPIRIMRLKPLALLLTLPAIFSLAQAETAILGEILVTAPRLQADILGATYLDAGQLSALDAATSDTAKLLLQVPGVSVQSAGGVSSLPIIHGLADDRLRIQVDGMDIIASCPNHMNPALSYIDPTHVGSIEVYAGTSPVSVGGDGIGGAIVVRSPAPKFAAAGERLSSGEAGAFYRSNGHGYGANLSATYASDSFHISYTGATAQSDNYDAGGNFKANIYGPGAASPTVTGRIGHSLPLDEVGSTAYETRNHTLGLAFKRDHHLFEAQFGYQDVPYQLYPNQRMDMLGNEAKRLNLRYKGDFDWGKLEARAWHEEVDHYMNFGADKRFYYGPASGGPGGVLGSGNGAFCSPMSATCAWGMPMYTASKTNGLTLKSEIPWTPQDLLRVGGEFQQYRLDDWWTASGAGMWPNTFLNINNGQRDRYALFGEWEKRLNPQWTTLAGLRYERVDMDSGDVHGYDQATFPTNPLVVGPNNQQRDAANFNNADHHKTDDNWDMTLLARYKVSPTQDLELGLAHKTRSPNLYERYAWSTWQMAALMVNWVGDGNGYVGNLNLKPEKATTLSASFDWHAADRAWEFKATPYYTRVDDYIDAVQWDAATNAPRAVPVTNQFTVLKFMNQSARIYGLDLSGKLPLAKTGLGELGLKGMVSYTRGENRDTGDNLYNIMPLHTKLALTQRLGPWRNSLEGEFVARKDDVSRVRNEMPTPGYGLVHLRARYEQKTWSVDFGIENLFDRLYYLPLGGAYLGQGTTMAATAAPTGSIPAWGTPVPGPGRSLYAGLNVKF
jgi:iron complex outermembrane receptor protein